MTRQRHSALWLAVFGALFLLSLDYWRWDDPVRLGWLNLPRWILYFVVLQLLLAGAIRLFALKFWRTDEDAEATVEDDETL